MSLYRATFRQLEPGAVIDPTWLWKMLRLRFLDDLRHRELVFESVRLAEFPSAPSRYRSVFAFAELADIVPYTELPRAEHEPEVMLVYEIRAESPTFRGDLMWAVRGQEGRIDMVEAARSYWSGTPYKEGGWFEVLAPCPVTVVRRVPDDEMEPHRGRLAPEATDPPSPPV